MPVILAFDSESETKAKGDEYAYAEIDVARY